MVTLKQLEALDAVVRGGSFQAGAQMLHRSHPGVISLLHKLETQLGFALFDRSGYRTRLTEAGEAFYQRSLRLLAEHQELEELAGFLSEECEPGLRIVIGDVTPLDETLQMLRGFSRRYPRVQLDLGFENLSGPRERLLDSEADLIIHHVDPTDPRFEFHKILRVKIIPVAAPTFLDFEVTTETRYRDLRAATQCIIRDTASHCEQENYFVLENAPCITVGDQHTKKAVILQGMAWGHMPDFMISDELETGVLISLAGRYIQGNEIDIVVARMAGTQRGKMAGKLWEYCVNHAGRDRD